MNARTSLAMVLGASLGLLAGGCSKAQQEKALADTQKTVNAYCDERAALLDSLQGEAGAR